MIVWINGTFGSGKTTVAHELDKRLGKSIIYRSVTGSKIPISRTLRKLRLVSGGSTASNGPIGSTNNQWG
ncbi:MAG TPA: AAA family ATPase [Virgibacillus sp.]|nr:AAA family ATPase [Virgibacillus sp.]